MAKSVQFPISILFFFFIAENVRADGSVCPEQDKYSTAISNLTSKLFCAYDSYVRPVRQRNETVDVKMQLFLKKIQFDEIKDTAEVSSIFFMSWTDYKLVWNPAEYDNIDEMRFMSYQIWTPDIGVYSSADQSSFSPYMRPIYCVVQNNGKVWCVPPSTHTTSCSADLTSWPYDRHTCDLVMGSWTHTGEDVNVSLQEPGIYITQYNTNREWELISVKSSRDPGVYSCCPNDTFPSVTFQFVLQRHSGSYTAIVVVPAIVLMLMTLVTWTKGDQSSRVILASLDVYLHFLFLQYLGNTLPSNGNSSPLIVTFYRDSMLLATMALLTSIIIRGLKRTSVSAPVWISGLSNWALMNRFGQILIFHNLYPKGGGAASEISGDEETNLVGNGTQSHTWDTFSSLLNLTFFVITFVTYLILLIGFIP